MPVPLLLCTVVRRSSQPFFDSAFMINFKFRLFWIFVCFLSLPPLGSRLILRLVEWLFSVHLCHSNGCQSRAKTPATPKPELRCVFVKRSLLTHPTCIFEYRSAFAFAIKQISLEFLLYFSIYFTRAPVRWGFVGWAVMGLSASFHLLPLPSTPTSARHTVF